MTGVSKRYADAWTAIVDLLVANGVDTCFGLPGDDLELLRALDAAGLDLVPCRDQRNAMYMATGYALQSGRPAVCALGKGPAVTHAATGLLEARESGAPVLVLAAGVPERRRGSGGFQELDQVAVTAPLVRWAHRVGHPDRVVPATVTALTRAVGPPPGPVYLEIPDDVRTAEILVTGPQPTLPEPLPLEPMPATPGPALAAIRASRRPVVLVGGGMRHRNDGGAVEGFAERLGAALFTTASGRGAVDERHPLFCGVAGLYAAAPARELWSSCDLVISLAGRLEETVVEGGTPWPPVPVVQVNIDPGGLSAEFPGPRVLGDARHAVLGWTRALDEDREAGHADATEVWADKISFARKAMSLDVEAELARAAALPGVRIPELLAALDATAGEHHVLVQENGLQDMWSYCFPFHVGGGSLVPSEQTPLGFGAAAAIGVKRAAPDHEVTAFVGDGAFLAARAEIAATAPAHGGILYVVLCNGGYGWLDAQRARLGLDAERHPFTRPGAPPPVVDGPDLLYRVLRDKATLTKELLAARRFCSQGGTAVLMVPVVPDDIPPPLREGGVVPQ
ncbi:thiamine pyrophosphate-binding protein [Streptomyces rimosus subsp. rimosus ATCC 10970]|uniref:Thiamine pyrophosphate-binding protein n=2 Tax=Streptomyces rimosus subsp. rimosus TaxID=132474 RepID=A0A8A1V1S2_STRR1|nr:thiamine pyrophosphate-binding protein [Streptomyces sp. SID5471]QDA03113.1 thiamine pyrophosphate-binding protein [Streptomyces rimosus]QGY68019.1 thiamine pyrophosphate-binding protein [Streptomyces rimosus R6-500]QST84862.1 thiamine pyrophosphate-binding protein [Streptomyces rimosus subsp. rimosus ATCC 10970]QTL85194.1 thiamine pyrophosphate-binding protein [Streptomyces rimosus subsp. rimosus]